MKKLFEINLDLDRAGLTERFASHGSVQVRDVLTTETAQELRMILERGTPWAMALRGGDKPETPPVSVPNAELATQAGAQRANRMA